MAIDFFQQNCKFTSKASKFGLCDDPLPSQNPAYIDEVDKSKWLGIVENDNNKGVDFIAIDACIEIKKADGKDESRCDGLLSYDKDLIFVELKNREGGQWVKKGRKQLTITYNHFKNNYDIHTFDNVYANICNSLRPISHSGHASNIEKFKDDTGLILKTDRIIKIP